MPTVLIFMMGAPLGQVVASTLPLWHIDAVSGGGVHSISLDHISRDDVVLHRFQVWLRWNEGVIPQSFEIEDRNWRCEFDAIVAAGEAAPRYENPHVLHNLL